MDKEAVHVGGRVAGHLQLPLAHAAAFAGLERKALHLGEHRVGVHHLERKLLRSLVRGSAGRYFDMRRAFLAGSFQAEVHQPVSGFVKANLLAAAADELHRAVGLDAHAGFLHAVLQGEDVHWDGHLLADGKRAGQGGEHHERRLYRNGFLRLAVGAFMGGHHHDADAAHILRQLEFHHIRGAGRHRAGLQRNNHRVEAVVLAGAADGVLVTADGGKRRQLSAVRPDHMVVHVPGFHSESLAAVHPGPGVRRLEGREVQKPLVHQGQGIGHGLAALLGDFDAEALLGMQFVWHGQDRLQPGGRVLHLHALHTVQADGKVVIRIPIGLQQGNVHIDIGRHLRSDAKAPGRVFPGKLHPFTQEHAIGILQGNEGLGSFCGRNIDGGFLAGSVTFLVGGETEHGEGLRVPAAGPAGIVRPVYQHGFAADMPGLRVPHQQQVSAPFLLGHVHLYINVLGGRCQVPALHQLHGGTVHVFVQAGVGAVPPPVPAHLVEGVLQRVAFHRAALRVHHGNAQLVGAVGFQEIGPDVLDAHIGLVGGEGKSLGGEALVAALFVHGGDHEGFQHTGGMGRLGQGELHTGRSVAVQPGVKQLAPGLLELGGGVVKNIVLEFLERGAFHAAQGELGMGPGAACRTAGEPLGANLGLGCLAAFQHLRIQGADFKPIGLDGLHMQRLLESAAAGLEIGVPVAGGVIGLGGNVKAEETVGAFLHLAGMELAFRGIDFQRHRMGGREVLPLVAQKKVHVEGVAGPPDAAFSVDEGLEALLHFLSAHVKAAQGALLSVGGLEVGGAAAGLGHHNEGSMVQREMRQSLSVRPAFADALQLEVVHLHLGAGKRPAGDEVGGGRPELRPVGIFRHQAYLRGHQLHRREAVSVHVEGGLGGVVGFLIIVAVPVVVVVPIVGDILVPDILVGL